MQVVQAALLAIRRKSGVDHLCGTGVKSHGMDPIRQCYRRTIPRLLEREAVVLSAVVDVRGTGYQRTLATVAGPRKGIGIGIIDGSARAS